MGRVWGFAESIAEVEQRRNEATAIIGEQIVNVAYFDLDYRRGELRPSTSGLHWVSDPSEWKHPIWWTRACDSLDFGIELRTLSGRRFSITWDPPGRREGMGISETPFIDSVLRPSTDVAAWDVTASSRWTSAIATPVTSIDLHFLPWDEPADQHWCTRVTLGFGDSNVIMMLGEGTEDGKIEPSANNIAVLFGETPIPAWEQRLPSS